MNENCCLCICFTKLYFFYWLLVVSLVILIAVPFVFSRSQWISLAGVLKMPRVSNVFKDYTSIKPLNKKISIINFLLCWSVTLLMFIQTLDHSSQSENRLDWILNEYNLYCKIVKYCILFEVCMIKLEAVSHSTLSPQMWCINGMKGSFTRTQICWQDLVK